MKYVRGNSNQGYRVEHSGKKRVHNPGPSSTSSEVTSRKMSKQDWDRFIQNKNKKK